MGHLWHASGGGSALSPFRLCAYPCWKSLRVRISLGVFFPAMVTYLPIVCIFFSLCTGPGDARARVSAIPIVVFILYFYADSFVILWILFNVSSDF
jgi:hypothetical protein